MAIIFELYVDCNTPEELAAMKTHFSGFTLELMTGKKTEWEFDCSPDIWAGTYDLHAFGLWSSDLSRSGVRSLVDAIECTEAGIRLYKHLCDGPAFQFARVAWEADLICRPELEKYLEPLESSSEKRFCVECVLSETLYEKLGKPKNMDEFKPDYYWTGYRGEEYRPLWSSDQRQLWDLYRECFPKS
ncbi:hypothetical protein [Gimesia aquarii]|uniref:Uncharacterized protein n=1 Tax=Gimesia aquarii TaxID=2527964 RepID=A0A517VSL1_9PLAN|nr:hypothetical protein [Gimesia aquarii]QDT95993.1 hypothetical protein V144x_14450 [Gimesia aquarii]